MDTTFFLPVHLLLCDFFQFVNWKWKLLCRVRLFATPWTVAHQAPLSMGFSMDKNTGVSSHAPLQGVFPPRDQTQVSCIVGGFFTIWATREACSILKSATFFPLSKSSFCHSHINLCWDVVTLMACKRKENIFWKTPNVDTQRHHLLGQTVKTILKTEGKSKIKTSIATELWQFSSWDVQWQLT